MPERPPSHLLHFNHPNIINRLLALRGFHSACADCPVKLTCVSGGIIGQYCIKCGRWFLQGIEVFLTCDAQSGDTVAVAAAGTCPVCDNGRPDTFHHYRGARLKVNRSGDLVLAEGGEATPDEVDVEEQ